MAASWLDVANSALLKLGTQLIANLTQAVTGARLCNSRLPVLVPMMLRKYPWKSAMQTVELAQLSTPPADPCYGFAFQLPSDGVRIWRLEGLNMSGTSFVVRQNQIWAKTGITTIPASGGNPATTTGSLPILTYVQNPYTTGPGFLDPLLIEAMACQLAADICYQITQSIPLLQELKKEAVRALQQAKSIDSMETPEVYDFEASEFLTSRFAGTGFLGGNYGDHFQ